VYSTTCVLHQVLKMINGIIHDAEGKVQQKVEGVGHFLQRNFGRLSIMGSRKSGVPGVPGGSTGGGHAKNGRVGGAAGASGAAWQCDSSKVGHLDAKVGHLDAKGFTRSRVETADFGVQEVGAAGEASVQHNPMLVAMAEEAEAEEAEGEWKRRSESESPLRRSNSSSKSESIRRNSRSSSSKSSSATRVGRTASMDSMYRGRALSRTARSDNRSDKRSDSNGSNNESKLKSRMGGRSQRTIRREQLRSDQEPEAPPDQEPPHNHPPHNLVEVDQEVIQVMQL
jgi:hypothetical protein